MSVIEERKTECKMENIHCYLRNGYWNCQPVRDDDHRNFVAMT